MPELISAFLTGSRAYGTPREDSDYDIVVLVTDPDTLMALTDLRDPGDPVMPDSYRRSIKEGRLNLITCQTRREFDLWVRGTNELRAMAPVTREFACAHFARLRAEQ